ncbi:hypothetical protein [Faecalimonas umbilicata]|uniref:hypothetical protein n=1 Tax=Faecalimonas umbilicata TaxID=1912855 RepID=UPI0022E19B4C|nr:hypothetical protein [Faecalimonas umbilicata]
MKNQKLFSKIFLYTFMVMFFVTVIAHVCLYFLAPQMTLSTNSFLGGSYHRERYKHWLTDKVCHFKGFAYVFVGLYHYFSHMLADILQSYEQAY